MDSRITYLSKICLLAGLYIITGKLGLLLALPPGYATVIWPPSGIAIGILMIYGWRLWPGVLIGSFLLNCYISGVYSPEQGLVVAKTLPALGIAIGSTLQALVGWWLSKRFFGVPIKMGHVKHVAGLFVLCGPIACIIASTIGVGTLYTSGVLPLDQLANNWLTWWAGDVFGVLVFMPLVLVAPGSGGKLFWREHRLGSLPMIAMIALIMPLGLTFYAWKITYEKVFEQQKIQFESLALESENALLHRMDSYEHALLGGIAYFLGSQSVEREEWREYVKTISIAENFPGINGIGFIDVVKKTQVGDYLAKKRKDGMPDFSIHPQTQGKPYYIVTYLEPEEANDKVIGLNIAFEGNRLEAANLSRDTGKPAITKKITLIQDTQKTPGFLLLYPLYKKDAAKGTVEERAEALTGWVFAPFIAKNFMKNLTKSQDVLLDLRIYDGDKETAGKLIYSSTGNTSKKPGFELRKKIKVMQQPWLIVWTSTPAYEQAQYSDKPLFVMVGGLLFTGLFGLFLMLVAVRRGETMEWMVKEKGYVVPTTIFLITVGASFYLYQELKIREEKVIRQNVESEVEKIKLLVESDSSSKLSALERMGKRWEAAGGTAEHLWRKDSYNYINHLDGLTSLQWVDSSYHVRWVEPISGNEKAIGLNILFNKERQTALEGAARRSTLTLTPPLDLVQGYKAFIAYSPVKINGHFDGLMVGLFAIDSFFSKSITQEARNYFDIKLSYENKPFFESALPVEDLETKFADEGIITLYDKKWVLRIIPSRTYIASQFTALPAIIFWAGVLIGALLALTARAVLIAKIRTLYLAKSNEALKISEEKYRLLLNGVEDYAIYWLDVNGIVNSWNTGAEHLKGYTSEEIIGKHFSLFFGDKDRDQGLPQDLLLEAKTKGKFEGEGWCVRKDGTRFWAQVLLEPIPTPDGKIVGFAVVVRDETSRRAQEKALKTSEETFRSAMEHASIGMALVNPTGRWLKVNKALCELLGYSEKELLATDFQSLTHPDDLEADLEHVRKLLNNEVKTYTLEKRYYHKNGNIVWTLLSVSLVRESNDDPKYFISQIQDITEQKEIERIKSEFISIVSHELRTPLTSIRGSLSLILMAMAKDLSAEVKDLIEIAHKNCERLILLINDILDIDKIAAGQMRFDMKSESLAVITQQAIQGNQAYAEKFNVRIESVPIDETITINVDSARFIQVLSNLLSNAAKFSPAGGLVRVETTQYPDRVRLSVIDQGPGIPEEFRTRIFGKFSQADSSATRSKGGTGLGLHITKQIVEQMKGAIGFETEAGKGTVFWVDFPLIKPAADTHTKKNAGVYYRPKRVDLPLILHVEDDKDLSNVLAAALRDKAEIFTAATLQQARNLLLQSQPVVLMVLDIVVPDGSGLQLLKEMETLTKHPIPVIILAADAPLHELEEKVEAILVKSRVTETKIVETILQVLEKNKGVQHDS